MKVLWVICLALLLFSSCDMMLYMKDHFSPSSPLSVPPAISLSSVSTNQPIFNETESVETPTIILMKGNNLHYGIPCFGENAIPAILGEYKLEMPEDAIKQSDADSPLLINSWLTSEFIYLSPERWKERTSLERFHAMEMIDDEDLYIVLRFPDTITDQAKWSILFCIPKETIDAGITDVMINRMIQNWTLKLSYYISISRNESQISLPAVIAF